MLYGPHFHFAFLVNVFYHHISVICSVSHTNVYLLLQITGNLLLFASVNVLGIYIHDKTEHSMRKVFHEAANCITARIEAEEENSKLVNTFGFDYFNFNDTHLFITCNI